MVSERQDSPDGRVGLERSEVVVTGESLTEPIAPTTGSAPTDAHLELNALLTKILLKVARRHRDDLPGLIETLQDRVLITSGGTTRRLGGWFEANVWRHGEQPVHELFVNADFGQGHDPLAIAEDVLVKLLHEAGHVFAEASDIKETSRDGRYHNRRFAEIALQLGLQVKRDAVIGHRTPRLSASGRHNYADLLIELSDGLTLTRESRAGKPGRGNDETSLPADRAEADAPTKTKYVFACCQCQTSRGRVTIRVARGSWRPAVIRCDRCGSTFEESLTAGRQQASQPSRDHLGLERAGG